VSEIEAISVRQEKPLNGRPSMASAQAGRSNRELDVDYPWYEMFTLGQEQESLGLRSESKHEEGFRQKMARSFLTLPSRFAA
jgi:hypothetical protein